MSNIFHLWLHVLQVGSFGNMKYAPHIENVYHTSAEYVFCSSVRFVLDSVYTKSKIINVTYTEMNTGRLGTAFCCFYAASILDP
jgi:hypothetical protein